MMLSRSGTFTALIVLLATFASQWALFAGDSGGTASAPGHLPVKKLPYQLGDWQGRDVDPLNYQSQNVLQLDDYIRRLYTNAHGEQVFVYIGYWKTQGGDYQAAKHSPLTCLPANGWRILDTSEQTISANAETEAKLRTKRLEASIGSNKSLVYYWFFAGDKQYTDEAWALVQIIGQKLFHGRSDGGIVEISSPVARAGRVDTLADKNIQDFTKHFYPALQTLTIDALQASS